MGKQLVILAAGIGRRYGGLKQLTPVGPCGQVIMDYTIYDAMRSGFDEVILVIRSETAEAMSTHVENGPGRHIPVTFIQQELNAIPAGFIFPNRTKPWGTTQAVIAAGTAITGPFAVANADDYYGAPAIAALGRFLDTRPTTPPTWAMISYAVADTLPAEGAVSRGLLRASQGYLRSIDEIHTMRRHPDGAVWDHPEGPRVIPGEAPVSMNLWGFGPEVIPDLEQRFRRFLAGKPTPDEECYLPVCVGEAVTETPARVAVHPAKSPWCGMTSASDLPNVKTTLARLVAEGAYPDQLWV